MAWKIVGKPVIRQLNRTLVEKFSEMVPAPHDRPKRPGIVEYLTGQFEAGHMRIFEWASAYCKETDKIYRVNGKHTSSILAERNGQFLKGRSVILEHYYCDTLEDVAALYCTFDSKVSARSIGDINRVYAASVAELESVPPRLVDICVSGIAYSMWEESAATDHTPEERAINAIEHPKFILWYAELMENSARYKTIKRVPVVGAMFGTWSKTQAESTKFWTAVRDETGPKPECPDRKLAKFLITTRLQPRHSQVKSVGRRETYVKCINFWNAWRRGDNKATAPFHPDAPTPKVT